MYQTHSCIAFYNTKNPSLYIYQNDVKTTLSYRSIKLTNDLELHIRRDGYFVIDFSNFMEATPFETDEINFEMNKLNKYKIKRLKVMLSLIACLKSTECTLYKEFNGIDGWEHPQNFIEVRKSDFDLDALLLSNNRSNQFSNIDYMHLIVSTYEQTNKSRTIKDESLECLEKLLNKIYSFENHHILSTIYKAHYFFSLGFLNEATLNIRMAFEGLVTLSSSNKRNSTQYDYIEFIEKHGTDNDGKIMKKIHAMKNSIMHDHDLSEDINLVTDGLGTIVRFYNSFVGVNIRLPAMYTLSTTLTPIDLL